MHNHCRTQNDTSWSFTKVVMIHTWNTRNHPPRRKLSHVSVSQCDTTCLLCSPLAVPRYKITCTLTREVSCEWPQSQKNCGTNEAQTGVEAVVYTKERVVRASTSCSALSPPHSRIEHMLTSSKQQEGQNVNLLFVTGRVFVSNSVHISGLLDMSWQEKAESAYL